MQKATRSTRSGDWKNRYDVKQNANQCKQQKTKTDKCQLKAENTSRPKQTEKLPAKEGGKLAPITLPDSYFTDYEPPEDFYEKLREQRREERMLSGRKRATKLERAQMVGYDCACCRPYYDALNLSPKARAERVNRSSRHRGYRVRSPTPEGYWNPLMPEFSEAK